MHAGNRACLLASCVLNLLTLSYIAIPHNLVNFCLCPFPLYQNLLQDVRGNFLKNHCLKKLGCVRCFGSLAHFTKYYFNNGYSLEDQRDLRCLNLSGKGCPEKERKNFFRGLRVTAGSGSCEAVPSGQKGHYWWTNIFDTITCFPLFVGYLVKLHRWLPFSV